MDASGLLKAAAALAVGAGALGGAAAMSRPIDDQRQDLQLSLADIEQTLPPDAALTQAFLGVFRGVAVNVLWQRAEGLKNEGKFYEAMQLADWITTLQPRYPKVWEFTSWNNAYNISVATHTPPERWSWVQDGINQLRDKGIYYNPNSLSLYRQLAWIYIHKVGEFQDDANQYYKAALAREWDHIFGGPLPVDDSAAYAERLRTIADAPDTLEALYAEHPGTRRLVGWLREKGYTVTDGGEGGDQTARQMMPLLSAFAYQWRDFHPADESEPHVHMEGEHEHDSVHGDETEAMDEDIRVSQGLEMRYAQWPDWAEDADTAALMAYARKQVITGSPIRMDPAFMLEVTGRFGELDWRHPASHAIYWTWAGVRQVEPRYEGTDELPDDLVNTRRNILISLQQLQRSGQVVFEPQTGYFNSAPDPRFYLSYLEEFDATEAEYAKKAGELDADRIYGSGFRNNMDQVVTNLYLYGMEDEAGQVLQMMRDRYAGTQHFDRFDRPLQDYIADHLRENLENPDQARTAIMARISTALVSGYGEGDGERAGRLLQEAKLVYDGFRQEYADNDTIGGEMGEVKPFPDLVADAAALALAVGELEPNRKVRVWEKLPDDIRRRIWPRVYGPLRREAELAGFDFDIAYQPPEGMAARPEPEPLIDDGTERGQIERQ